MSPIIFRAKGYRFFLFSREETRKHVHVLSIDGEAKFWLEPAIELAQHYRLTRAQLKDIESVIEGRYLELVTAWEEHFGSWGDEYIGAWDLVLAHDKELFMPYEDFPWFREQPVRSILHVEELMPRHF